MKSRVSAGGTRISAGGRRAGVGYGRKIEMRSGIQGIARPDFLAVLVESDPLAVADWEDVNVRTIITFADFWPLLLGRKCSEELPRLPMPIISLTEALNNLTVDNLKSLMRWLPEASRIGKKSGLVEEILRNLAGDRLQALWEGLDKTQRLAVAEATYAEDGCFNATRFRAKYGRLPNFSVRDERRRHEHHGPPTALCLFLYYQNGWRYVPADLNERLMAFVPAPEPVRLDTVDSLPGIYGESPLSVRLCERDALADLPLLLRLVDQGKLKVSEKTALPGTATLQLLCGQLSGSDYYAEPVPGPTDQEIGPIKAFSWPMLLQAAGLVQRNGSKLVLSKAGLTALTTPTADVLVKIWRKWLKATSLDEFSRIDVIKGQKAKGGAMAAVAPRRAAIAEMLQRCPAGKWISIDAFSRFMVATGHTFDVARDPWSLYICEPDYGSLGHSGYHDWDILQLRYMLCFLFEYVAPLGIIDIAYTEPAGARPNFHDMWGTDELQFLSRYDGLAYFRVTSLGAYCLGASGHYTPAPVQSSVRLSVMPGMQVKVIAGRLSAEESLVLDMWATEEADRLWRLDLQKAIVAVERGHDIAELREFLQARDDQPVPDTVESFIKRAGKQGKALKVAGTTLLIDCNDAQMAAMLATRKETAHLCLRAGDKHVVVRLEDEDKFRTHIRALGYGMTA
ncbi:MULTISPECIES: hypothetical protein [Cupriavidus]|uniref:hypothetical protein n=1 Tax=Cupriavidus TaxID=106589 RepID=UPI001F001A47|nr:MULTISPECIES: hypothetical protein [Cupriavidus]MCO4865584.1 hypothetical protein [Cupriavidus sp. WGlv3]MCO4893304.1 hypothetical protein [Cupriavidus sp. WGtm5]